MSTRPGRLVVVAGTGTEIGKTWVGCELVAVLRRDGVRVAARKPAQSFDATDPVEQTDAGLLGAASAEPPEAVCPPHRWYPTAMAPPMAADALGRPNIALAELVDEIGASWPVGGTDVGLVELAGGLWSPVAHDGSCLELTAELGADAVLLVADAGLGTINSVRPATAALEATGAATVTLLNRFDPTDELHRRNLAWLVDVDSSRVVTTVAEVRDALMI